MRVAKGGKRQAQNFFEHERVIAKKFWKDSFKKSKTGYPDIDDDYKRRQSSKVKVVVFGKEVNLDPEELKSGDINDLIKRKKREMKL